MAREILDSQTLVPEFTTPSVPIYMRWPQYKRFFAKKSPYTIKNGSNKARNQNFKIESSLTSPPAARVGAEHEGETDSSQRLMRELRLWRHEA
jgi:hypothetical protein